MVERPAGRPLESPTCVPSRAVAALTILIAAPAVSTDAAAQFGLKDEAPECVADRTLTQRSPIASRHPAAPLPIAPSPIIRRRPYLLPPSS